MQQPRRLSILPIGHKAEGVDAPNAQGQVHPAGGRVIGEGDGGYGSTEQRGVKGSISEVGGAVQMDGGHIEPKVHLVTGGRRYGRKLVLSLCLELAIKRQEEEDGHVFHIANITECQRSTP